MPCDFLIISGSAVVNESILTGESQPLVKEGIAPKDDPDELLDLKQAPHKSHVLYGGTEVLQMLTSEESSEYEHLGTLPFDKGSENAIVCTVLKNGFETKQGKLMRTILFSSERVSAESAETYYFLLILLCFALASSYYVTTESLKDPDRSRYKIMLRCIMIITNVVPPELPMELSMAVNYSILQMIKKAIFCTEPFRIPSPGKIDVCCFDKTGTLTKNDLDVKGVIPPGHDTIVELDKVAKVSDSASRVIGGCHTLAYADKQLMGDPIEKQSFEGL